jgi:inosine/xanthosine triphosphatase
MRMSEALGALRHVAVGSSNPVKVDAVREVLRYVAPEATVAGIAVESGVPDQPWGDEETIRGARTRALAAREALSAELGVGIEGGLVKDDDGSVRTCAWAVVVGDGGREGVGGSLAMPLPERVAVLVRAGLELGDAIDAVTGSRDVKYGAGAVGVLTAGLVDRQEAYEVIVSYALAPFVSAKLWED